MTKLRFMSAAAAVLAMSIAGCDGSGWVPPSQTSSLCLAPDGDTAALTETLRCYANELPNTDTECRFSINTVTGSGAAAFQLVNASPATVLVDKGDADTVSISLTSGSQTGRFSVQATHENCRNHPQCRRPRTIATGDVSTLCP